jgi:hypothetical protein
MKPVNKPKQAAATNPTHKTKDDFLRWLRKKEALKKQAAKEPITLPKRPTPPRKH